MHLVSNTPGGNDLRFHRKLTEQTLIQGASKWWIHVYVERDTVGGATVACDTMAMCVCLPATRNAEAVPTGCHRTISI